MEIPFFRPEISEAEINEVVETLKSGWLTTGKKTKRFEQEFAEFVGAKYAVALNSCTAALHLALEAIGLQKGDLVMVPTMTFAATAEVVRYFDAYPVFVDCDETLCIDPIALQKTIENITAGKPTAGLRLPYGRLKTIIPMHYGGYSCQMDKIMAMAERYSLSVIEDCAHSFPAYFRKDENSPWIQTGMWGDVGCFSFYANKCITTGEGGMAVTNDETLARRMSLMSLHGMNNDAWKRYTSQGSWYYEIVAPGFKYNLSDIAASIGLHQLNRANEFLNQRTRVAQKYTESFKGNSFIQAPPEAPETRKHSWHLYSIRLNLEKLTIDRAEFIRRLKEKGISCSVHWMPLHLHPYYRDAFCLKAGFFPCAEKEWPRLISLPIFPSLQEKEIEYVVEAIDEISNKYEKR